MSTAGTGGVAAIVMGFLGGLFLVLTFLASPDAYDAGVVSWHYVLADYALAMIGLLGLAAVPAISDRVANLDPGWLHWTRSVATLGFALLAVLNFWQAEYEMLSESPSYSLPTISYETNAGLMFEGSPSSFVEDLVSRAPHGWIEVAGVGLWILSVSWLALQSTVLPHGLAGTGIAAGFLAFCAAAGANLNAPELHVLGTLGVAFVTPFWFAWTGVVLLRSEQAARLRAVPIAPVNPSLPDNVLTKQIEPSITRRRKNQFIRLWPN